MAEENISLQMTPTTIDEDGIRRNSTGKKVSSSSGEKVLPHYLRASTGSCHDFCKYGRKHAFEEKARHPIMKRVAAKPNVSQSLSLVDTVASLGKKKSSATKTHSKSACNMTRSLDSLNSLKGDVIPLKNRSSSFKLKSDAKPYAYETPKSIKQKVPASTGKLEGSSKKVSTEATPKNSSGKCATSPKPSSAMVKPLSSGKFSGVLNGNGNMKTGKRMGTSLAALKKVQSSPTALVSTKSSHDSVASLNMKQRSLKKVTPPRKSSNKIGNAEPAESENDGIHEKTLYVIKMKTENNTSELPQDKTCATQEAYAIGMETESNILELDRNETCEQEEYVIEMETKNDILELDRDETCATEVDLLPHPPSLSPKPSSSPDIIPYLPQEEEEDEQESEYTISETEDDTYSDISDAESFENLETIDRSDNMHRRSGLDYVEDEDEKAKKLKFRRGKVVEMQSENNAPRRLKFRRGRVLDNQDMNAIARSRRYKKREDGDGDDDDCTETSTEKVVLKHQDVQGKKDAQGLFNNVIEETASKLVETRKSKVKALVGAFETVISLQDNKPSANTGN